MCGFDLPYLVVRPSRRFRRFSSFRKVIFADLGLSISPTTTQDCTCYLYFRAGLISGYLDVLISNQSELDAFSGDSHLLSMSACLTGIRASQPLFSPS
jgi:hypothetical protein